VVGVPVRRVAVATGGFDAGILESLGMLESVVALSSISEGIHSPGLKGRLQGGHISPLGDRGALDYERIKQTAPELVLCPDLECASQVEAMGIPASVTYTSMDNGLEARLHFVDYLSAFGEREGPSGTFRDGFFKTMARLGEKAAHYPRASVMWALFLEKRAFVEPGSNWIAATLQGLGGDYLFSGTPGASTVEVSLEHLVDKGRDADVLILYPGIFEGVRDKAAIVAKNPALAPLGPLGPQGRTYMTLPLFYESFGHLEEIAGELFTILHPSANPDRELKYFREIP
jgi:iron complex transport system substrate-binding protein